MFFPVFSGLDININTEKGTAKEAQNVTVTLIRSF